MPTSIFNTNTILLIAGLLLLFSSLGVSLVRLRQGLPNVPWFNVLIALASCILITTGIVRLTFSSASTPNFAAMGGFPGASSGNLASSGANTTNNTTMAAPGGNGPVNAPNSSSLPAGGFPGGAGSNPPPEIMTQIAQGTIPALGAGGSIPGAAPSGVSGTTPNANGAANTTSVNPSNGSTTSGVGGASGGFAAGPGGASANPIFMIVQGFAALITALIAGIFTVISLIVYFRERRKEDFNPANSYGLLNAGAGIFVVVAAIIIPMLPGQLTARANASALPTSTGPAPTRYIAQTPTATTSPTATVAPTDLPTLTPTITATPVILYTQVAYAYAESTTTTNCTLTALTIINLRGDPSTKQQGIGKVFAGSLLKVTDRTDDKKWWHVIYSDGTNSVEGWVNADYVSQTSECADQSIPVTTATATASKTPTTTPSAAVQGTGSSTVKAQATSDVCLLMTIAPTVLRPGPSQLQAPLVNIPEKTALTANGKSTNSGWWLVTYNGQTGWVGGASVIAALSCDGISPVTLTPSP